MSANSDDNDVEPHQSRSIINRIALLLCLAGLWWLGTIGGLFSGHQNLTLDASQAATVQVKDHDALPKSKNGTKPQSNNTSLVHHSTLSSSPITTLLKDDIDNNDRLVISMKTMPSRIAYLQPTLDSLLLHQTRMFDQFYLVLPQQPADNPDYIIPAFLRNYTQEGLVTLLRPETDYGAIDKIIHTLPVEQAHLLQQQQKQQSTTELLWQAHHYRILYLDDDMIYAPNHVEVLANKSQEYPTSVVALSGARLRSHFRQIGHTNPSLDRHPYIFYRLGGVDSMGDPPVDIVQGFMGVLVRLSFFNVDEFGQLAVHDNHNTSIPIPDGVRRSDDYVICGYLERRNITRRLVDGGLVPKPNETPSHIGNLGKTMHRNAMVAAHYLQTHWGIWQEYQFEPYLSLSDHTRQLMDCEARHVQECPKEMLDNVTGKPVYSKVTQFLDEILNVSAGVHRQR